MDCVIFLMLLKFFVFVTKMLVAIRINNELSIYIYFQYFSIYLHDNSKKKCQGT